MKVTTKGQITIPSNLRKIHGIRPNSEVEFKNTNSDIMIRPIQIKANELDKKLKYARTFGLCKNPIFFSEISNPFDSLNENQSILNDFNCEILPLPIEAGFLTGKAFL